MFINLKDLKANIGSPIKLTLNSSAVYEQKEWKDGSFNVFNYKVLLENVEHELSATDALKRKLDELKVGDDFLLSWEEFTKDGQMRNYWKVVKEDNSGYDNIKQPASNGAANGSVVTINDKEYNYDELNEEQQTLAKHIEKSRKNKIKFVKNINEFEQKLQESKAQQAVVKTNKDYVSPARNGMIFNQTCEQFRYFKCTWTQEEFVDNFNRLSAYLDACEDQKEKPFELPSGEKKVEPKVEQPANYNADDLPF